jgi:flagellar protein FliL
MAASGKKGGGAMVLIIVVFLLSIAGAGAGFTVGTLISGEPAPVVKEAEAKPEEAAKSEEAHATKSAGDGHGGKAEHGEVTEEAAAEEAEPEEEPVDLHTLKVTRFPPVLTTLAEPKGKWIRLEGAILTGAEGETPPELLAEKSGEQILAFLRTLKLSQIEGPSGYLGLKSDLTETVKVLSGGEVQGVLIHGLVVE